MVSGDYAAARHSCKYRRLHAPATTSTCSERSPVSGDLFAFVAALSIAARFLFSSILSSPSAGVRMMASTSPRSASVASAGFWTLEGLSQSRHLCRYSSAVSGWRSGAARPRARASLSAPPACLRSRSARPSPLMAARPPSPSRSASCDALQCARSHIPPLTGRHDSIPEQRRSVSERSHPGGCRDGNSDAPEVLRMTSAPRTRAAVSSREGVRGDARRESPEMRMA